jgi:peptide/nickel transport system substrate-binding protein
MPVPPLSFELNLNQKRTNAPWPRVLAVGATFVLAGLIAASPGLAAAKTFRFANSTPVLTMDPHGALVVFTEMMQGCIYEGLVRINKDNVFEPALAKSYSRIAPDTWRFILRPGVRFHDGSPLTSDDIVYSINRALAPSSAIKVLISTIAEVRKVDEGTVDIVTKKPDPILDRNLPLIYIMSKSWVERNGVTQPLDYRVGNKSFATDHANGTGPYILKSSDTDGQVVLTRNPDWWDVPLGNVTEAIFTPIANPATRVAALLSGAVDLMEPVPVQNIQEVASTPGFKVLRGPQMRVIYLGMDQARDELLSSNVKGRNPFKDLRVRKAIYEAIDVEAIHDNIMRGGSTPTALLVGPGANGYDPVLDHRFPYDLSAARKLLAEAGYGEGFEIGLNCANDRDVSPEEICKAVASMLARAGIRVGVVLEPSPLFLPKFFRRQTSFFLTGWLDATFDALNPISALMATNKDGRGEINISGYSNSRVDALTDLIETESDTAKRQAAISEVWRIYHDDVVQVPLHHQWLAWGMKSNVDVPLAADDIMKLHLVTVH